MTIIKRLLFGLLLLLVLAIGAGFIFVQSKKPQLEGSLSLTGLNEEVEVYFDEYGIPHIYAQNEEDAYRAMGYVHAQDRLWQMELLRRLGSGRLAEILGPDLIKTDRLFRTLGIHEHSKEAAKTFEAIDPNNPMKKAVLAYYNGVNQFIENGSTPVEFHILGIEKKPFTIVDCYDIFGYMAFSFAQAFRTDPLVMRMHNKLGNDYLKDLDIHWHPDAQKIPVYNPKEENLLSNTFGVNELFETLPSPPWIGSNAWVIGPSKTKSGKVIFSNDTHIGFAQPSVWYEAHIEFPGTRHYGNYLGGIPFAVTGHSDFSAIGLTMFENDDIDFYVEQLNPENSNQVKFKDQWENMKTRTEIIKVKGEDDLTFEVKETRHGPILNEALDDIKKTTDQPVSCYWIYTKFQAKNLEATYGFIHSKSMDECRKYAAMIHSPGLNAMYGDADGNIAWWAMGKLPRRPGHVNSKLFLDGTSGADEIIDYFEFKDNPQAENPPSGYVYSANNQPDTSGGYLHQGYYIPEDRAKRIVEILTEDKKWDLEMAKAMINDNKSAVMPGVAKEIVRVLSGVSLESENETKALQLLSQWDGDHQLNNIEPTIFTKLLYLILKKTYLDELREADFKTMLHTVLLRRSTPFLFKNDASKWWDDINTSNVKETRKEIFHTAFQQAISDLENQLGKDINQWQWHKVHTIEHSHLLGRSSNLKTYFNVGPFPVKGGHEVLNNMAFRLNEEGKYKVSSGPAKRRIIDFSDLEHSVSVLPTGQSGNPMSPHYSDQAQLFVDGKFRLQMTNKAEIIANSKKLVLKTKE